MEYQNEHGKINAGLTTGIIGTAGVGLGLLNSLLGNGQPASSEDHCVNRYELSMQRDLVNKDMEIAYLRGRDAAKSDSLELYRYIDGKIEGVNARLCAQDVVNAQVVANISCMQQSIATLQGLTKTVIPIASICPQPAVATTTAG